MGMEAATNMELSGRAAKRQQQRERRRVGRAAPEADLTSAVVANENDDAIICRSAMGEAPIRLEAPTLKVGVKHTFIDVACDDSDDCSEISEGRIELPAAQFSTTDTAEFEEFRRDYRKFRLGFHRGARGEVSAPKSEIEWMGLGVNCTPPRGQMSEDSSESGSVRERCTANSSSSTALSPALSPGDSEDDDEDTPDGTGVPLKARALKRQRQRERRRTCKAELREAREVCRAAHANSRRAQQQQQQQQQLQQQGHISMAAQYYNMNGLAPGCWQQTWTPEAACQQMGFVAWPYNMVA